jgi:photosystem II stability/assembly factor-like uncharacterized protein
MVRLYAAMREAVLAVEAAATAPSVTRRLEGATVECLAAHPEAPERVLVGTFDDGLHRSNDGGGTFERVGEGLESEAVTALAPAPDDPTAWWVGTEPSAVYHSGDGGATVDRREGLVDLPSASGWSFPPRPDTHHVRWIAVDPHEPGHLYVGIEAGALVRTYDGGETWEDRVPSSRRDNHSLATHPDAPDRAWSAAGDGFAETTDGGRTWRHPQDGLDHRYCWSVAVDAGDPDRVLVSSASGAFTAHRAGSADSYIYRREGDGRWERLDGTGIPTGEGVTRAVLARGLEAGVFYAAHNRGLYRTGDGGDSWDRLDVEWPDGFESSTARGLAVVP